MTQEELVKRIEKLEKEIIYSEVRHLSLATSFDEMQSEIDAMQAEPHERIRIPHRCPVCNGSTYDFEGAACLPCDGRGIVWG